MKKIYLLISIIAFLNSYQCYSQNQHTFNFLNINERKFETKQSKLNVDTFQVIIENINRSLYEIIDTKTQENYNIQVPEILQGIKLPAYFNIENSSTKESESFVKDFHGKIKVGSNSNFENNYNSLSSVIGFIDTTILFNNKILELLKNCDLTYNDIQNQRDILVTSLLNIPLSSNINLHDRIKSTINTQLLQGLHLINLLEMEMDSLRNAGMISNEVVSEIKESSHALNNFYIENKVSEIESNFKLINQSTFSFKTGYIDITHQDETTFLISAKSKQPIPCGLPMEREFKVKIRGTRGYKIDFSSGLFANFGNSTFMNDNFYKKNVNDSLVQIYKVDIGKRIMPSIGALVHLHLRTSIGISPALSLGASTTSGFETLNFHGGISGIIGRKERVIFTFGCTAREVTILDRKFKTDTPYNKNIVPDEVPTNKLFPYLGFFTSLTYNIYKFNVK